MTIHSTDGTYRCADPLPSRARRDIPRASRGHFVGQSDFWRGDVCQIYGFESLLEFRASLLAIYRTDFLDLEEQVGPIPFRGLDGKARKHFLDFRLTLVGGSRIGLVVKPWRRADTARFKTEMQVLRPAATPAYVDRLCVVTERHIDPVALANAHLFHDARAPVAEIDDAVLADVRDFRGSCTIRDFLQRTGHGGAGYFPVIRHIRLGNLKVPADAPIGPDTIITAKAA